MSEKLKAPRGTFDILPEQEHDRARVEAAAKRIFGAAGYSRIETPAFETTELFARGVGESTEIVQKEMYSFEDQGGRSLTLRPEGTAPVCRAYVEHGMHKLPQPVKLWYLSNFFRAETPQAGRFRQFWQVGAESIGSDQPTVDAELILLLAELLEELGVSDLRIRIASLGSADARSAYREKLSAFLRDRAEEIAPEVRARIDLNPLRAFDSKDPGTQKVMESAPLLADWISDEDREHFNTVLELLQSAGLEYEVDPTLVRGLDYYTRTVFEFTSDKLGAQSGVGGGGRYDGLIELIGGPQTPACGWAAGIERILLAGKQDEEAEGGVDSDDSGPVPDVFVAFAAPEFRNQAFELATATRRTGLETRLELAGRSLKGQLKQADRSGARYCVIVGDGDPQLKDMGTGDQRELPIGLLVETLLNTKPQ